jgi:hypothetical protein
MSAVNRRYSHSFAQTTDDSADPPQQRDDDDAASSVRAGQAVTTSDGMPFELLYPLSILTSSSQDYSMILHTLLLQMTTFCPLLISAHSLL